MPKSFRQLNRYRDIRKEDLIAFVGPCHPLRGGGTVPLKSSRGHIDRIRLYRIESNYYHNETEIWPPAPRSPEEKYPHRFKFADKPILELSDIHLAKLSGSTKKHLHDLISQIFWEGEPSSLVDLITHGSVAGTRSGRTADQAGRARIEG